VESKLKIKNILTLILFYTLGFISSIVIINLNREDFAYLLSKFREERVIQSIVDIQIDQEQDKTICEEEKIKDKVCPVLVDISGAVKKPGVYCFEEDSVVVDAVKKAEGFTSLAAIKYIAMKVNLATILQDNSKIYIPYEEDLLCEVIQFKLPKEIIDITIPKSPTDDSSKDSDCVSINNATKAELETLNGVGPSTAQKIIDARPFSKLEDILNVSGIGQLTYDKFKEDICI
jgi:competence protein ComEA